MGLWTCWHIHISLLICLCFSPLTDGLVVSISPLLSILSKTVCHRNQLRTMLFLFSILHSFLFPLFLSKRRCLWLATSTWLIKKAVRLTWRWRKHLCLFLIMYLLLKRAQCVKAPLNVLHTGIYPPYWTGGQMCSYYVQQDLCDVEALDSANGVVLCIYLFILHKVSWAWNKLGLSTHTL